MTGQTVFAWACIVFWLMVPTGAWLTWRWRDEPERVLGVARVVGPAMWMSAQRYARMLPSLVLVAVGMSLTIVPAWWGAVSGVLDTGGYPFRPQDSVVLVVGLVGFVTMLLAFIAAILTATLRIPKSLVFPFLREGADPGETSR